MADELKGRKVAMLATDGVEQVEMTEPRKAVEAAGAEVHLVSLAAGEIQGFNHLEAGDKFSVDKTAKDASAEDYDGLLIPGGVSNSDFLRADPDAVKLARDFMEAGKPVGVICHAGWVLVEAGVVEGRTLTSWPSLQTDIRNAGGNWVDEELVIDAGLFTSRKPDDLPAFCAKAVEEFAEGRHEEQAEKTHQAISS
ncbi:MAG: type 1 glutamine amidotransferase [Actinomycetota bacterium]|nr:type 1 glutamine amidotransferase [Actinomycetota bacterium]